MRVDAQALEQKELAGWLIAELDRVGAVFDMRLVRYIMVLLRDPEVEGPEDVAQRLREFLGGRARVRARACRPGCACALTRVAGCG